MGAKGAFNNYVDRIMPFFDPPPPLHGQFLYSERGQKQTFFDPLPPHLVPVVIECPLSGAICIKFFPDMKNAIGLSNCCFLYGAVGLFNCIWGIVTIPDNRGKSLVKVEEMYEKKKGYENSVDTKDEES